MAKLVKTTAPKSASPPPLKRNRQPRSCVWWFLMGITVGAVGGNIISTRRADPASAAPAATAGARESTPAPVQPTFHFPQLLNDTKVEMIDRPPPPSAPRPQLPPPIEESPPEAVPANVPNEPELPPQRPSGSGFVVQAGSFKNTVDAERRRAELARLGVTSSVQTGTLPNGQTAYRVRTGVYSTRKAAEQARDLLKRNGKDAVAFPVK